jgi:hypothetical protein
MPESLRLNVGTKVAVWIGRERRAAQLRTVSRFGAFVSCDPPPPTGAAVKLVLETEHEPRTLATGQVAYQIARGSAARLGTPPGIGIRFDRPLPSCRKIEAAAPRFTGELAEVGAPYLLAMVERTQRTCRLRFTRGSESAIIDCANGEILRAQLSSRDLPTDDVVSDVMRWKDGTFAMSPPATDVRATAAKSIAQHLIEYERRRGILDR